jgi:hypothetical protein
MKLVQLELSDGIAMGKENKGREDCKSKEKSERVRE